MQFEIRKVKVIKKVTSLSLVPDYRKANAKVACSHRTFKTDNRNSIRKSFPAANININFMVAGKKKDPMLHVFIKLFQLSKTSIRLSCLLPSLAWL